MLNSDYPRLVFNTNKGNCTITTSGDGTLRTFTDNLEETQEVLLSAGDVFDIPPKLRHQMEAIEDTQLFEFSTQHFEEDSYRSVKGD